MSDLRHPADFLAAAELECACFDDGSAHRPDPEHVRRVRHIGAIVAGDRPSDFMYQSGVRSVAFSMALLAAANRRVADRARMCVHVPPNPLGAGFPLTVMLGTGCVACDQCGVDAQMVGKVTIDDGRCDVCDEPATYFYAMVTQLGTVTFLADVCPSCREWSLAAATGGPESEPER